MNNSNNSTATSSATTRVFHTITTANYKQHFPNDVTDVYITEEVLQLPDQGYTEVLSAERDEDGYLIENESLNAVNVILPDSITEIRRDAFNGCNLIKSIAIPNNVTHIREGAFHWCFNLESIKLPDNLQEIGNNAFIDCRQLKEVVIPDSVTTLGRDAFYACRNIESVTLSKSLTSISGGAFFRCSKLRSIYIPEGVTTIGSGAFENCYSLQSIILPQSLQEIQKWAFEKCYSLFSIYIPTSVATINRDVFNYCYRLENIIIPENCSYFKSTFSNEYNSKKFNHLDKIIEEYGQDWLKHRFNNLPLHQLCHDKEITIEALRSIPDDDPLLKSVDKMNMTPLHVLSCNPNATLEMIRTLASKYPNAAFVINKNGIFPVDLYLVTKIIVQLEKSDDGTVKYEHSDEIMSLMDRGTLYTIHDLIKYGVGYDKNLWDILLAFQGLSGNEQLSSQDDITGLIPFMTAAVVKNQPLEFVYKMAMMADPTLIKKERRRKIAAVLPTDLRES